MTIDCFIMTVTTFLLHVYNCIFVEMNVKLATEAHECATNSKYIILLFYIFIIVTMF